MSDTRPGDADATPPVPDSDFRDLSVKLPSRPQNHILWNRQAGTVSKQSNEKDVIAAEAAWYAALHPDSDLAPSYYGCTIAESHAAYVVQYVPWPSAASLMLAGWSCTQTETFLHRLAEVLTRLHVPAPPASVQQLEDACRAVLLEKPLSRLEQWRPMAPPQLWDGAVRVNGSPLPSVRDAVRLLPELAQTHGLLRSPGFRRVHGDLYPGNILYDVKTKAMKLVDPRGHFGVVSPFGDPVYDLAKLAHSFVGGFDYLVAGRYSLASDFSSFDVGLPEETSRVFMTWLDDMLPLYSETPERVALAHVSVLLSLPGVHVHDPRRQAALAIRGLQALSVLV